MSCRCFAINNHCFRFLQILFSANNSRVTLYHQYCIHQYGPPFPKPMQNFLGSSPASPKCLTKFTASQISSNSLTNFIRTGRAFRVILPMNNKLILSTLPVWIIVAVINKVANHEEVCIYTTVFNLTLKPICISASFPIERLACSCNFCERVDLHCLSSIYQ